MAGKIEGLNNWIKHWSGIAGAIAAIIIALGVIFGFTGRIKDWALDDIYDTLYTIQNNDLKHIDLSLQRSRQIEDLMLDILTGIAPQEEAILRRARIEIWYAQELEALLKAPADRKKAQ
jgi:hypothetical protein